MATLAQLEQALIQADQAGNVEDATALANEIRKLQAEQESLKKLETSIEQERKQTRTERLKDIAEFRKNKGRIVSEKYLKYTLNNSKLNIKKEGTITFKLTDPNGKKR